MLKLNLGCGDRKLHGFINVDAREEVEPDIVADITSIHDTYKDVDLIYACHVLEHFPRKPFPFQPKTYMEVLKSWYSALKVGGTLRISVPNLEAACEHYMVNGDMEILHSLFYGGQKYDFDFHYHGWDSLSLCRDLIHVGFKEVNPYSWRETEHSHVDDYSQAYLPHMDKVYGKLMSLNLEAIK